jgi:hypothetical protein
MEVGGHRHAPAALPPGKRLYPLYRRLGGLQDLSGRCGKSRPLPGFNPRTVQPVASRYTDRDYSVHVLRLEHWGYVEFKESSHIEYTPYCRTLPSTSHSAIVFFLSPYRQMLRPTQIPPGPLHFPSRPIKYPPQVIQGF